MKQRQEIFKNKLNVPYNEKTGEGVVKAVHPTGIDVLVINQPKKGQA